jgi:hypothetical protein
MKKGAAGGGGQEPKWLLGQPANRAGNYADRPRKATALFPLRTPKARARPSPQRFRAFAPRWSREAKAAL